MFARIGSDEGGKFPFLNTIYHALKFPGPDAIVQVIPLVSIFSKTHRMIRMMTGTLKIPQDITDTVIIALL